MGRPFNAEQLAELDRRVSAAERELAEQVGKPAIVSGEAMKLIEFHAADYLRRCLDTIAQLSAPEASAVTVDEPIKEALRTASTQFRSIMQATIDGKVCDDVAWYSDIETLHDFCGDCADKIDAVLARPG